MHIRYLTKFVFLNLILFIACIFLSSKALANVRGCPSVEDKNGIEDRVIKWLFVEGSNSLAINRSLSEHSTILGSSRFLRRELNNPLERFLGDMDSFFWQLNGAHNKDYRDDSQLLTVTNENPLFEARKAWSVKEHKGYFFNLYDSRNECYIWSWKSANYIVNYGVAIFNLQDDRNYANNKVFLCGIKHHLFRLGYLNAINIPDDFLMTKDNIKSSKNYEIREDNFYFLTRLISSFGPKLNSGMTRIETKNSIKKYLKDLCFAN